jgi:site-specific DNA-methyltransferase (adenine-specific)
MGSLGASARADRAAVAGATEPVSRLRQSQHPLRKEVIGRATLYLGDCRDIVPTLGKVDAVVTDPPYGINGGSGTINVASGKGLYGSVFPDTPEYIENVIAPAFRQALDICDRAAVTPGHKCNAFYPGPDIIGGYFQPAATGLCVWGSCNFQPIFFYGRDPRIGRAITPIAVPLNEAGEKNGHPCAKPLKAWTWLVNKVALSGQVVLDPFMGSGTTGVACHSLGIDFIGIELDPAYFDIACKRIEDAQRQADLFIETPAIADRNGDRQDGEIRLGLKDESGGAKQSSDLQTQGQGL